MHQVNLPIDKGLHTFRFIERALSIKERMEVNWNDSGHISHNLFSIAIHKLPRGSTQNSIKCPEMLYSEYKGDALWIDETSSIVLP